MKDALAGDVASGPRFAACGQRRSLDGERRPPSAIPRVLGHEAARAARPAVAAIEAAGRSLHDRRLGALHTLRRELVHEARGDRAHPLAVAMTVGGYKDMGAAAGAGEADVSQAPLLF